MSTRNNESQKSDLALAMAMGQSVPAWARKNEVARRTAYNWSRSREVRAHVKRIRRRVIDRAVGRLSKNATAAADQIARLARGAKSEAVQLQASRAVLAELMAVSNYATIEQRLAEVERKLRDSDQPPAPASQPDPSANPV
jgi:hypothetical protein